jgi:ribonuclease E
VTDEPVGVKGSTRLEATKQRRREGREAGRRRTVITEAEFLARREAVDRVMVVRNKEGRTQMGVLEDGVLVEHYIDQATTVSMAGNIYLGRVQNVLPSMEAAFVDIGKGRNAVLYAGEVNWDAAGLESNQPKRIENALSSGQSVLVQVTKDPIGHKGARLTSQISLPGRYLVYVPNSSMTGISRKLPDTERARLKKILRDVVPDSAGVIVRTAAEGASEEELRADVERLTRTWEDIQARSEAASTPKAGKSKGKKKNGGSGSSTTGTAPLLLHGEPDLTVRVIRDVFNEDFKELVVSGEQAWNEIHPYITSVAPDLAERVTRWTSDEDLFTHHRVDEQLAKAMDRKVWLPSGGSLVIDRTEAMTVVDVNTGKFVGSGGNLEETVTKNNLEAAEEIVRQLRLRDIGGIIVIDFIDMVLESNRDLVVRRLLECLGRDRTKHQVAEVTSLGLVQMTRKRVGSGLIEVFSETCEHCNGRGFIIHSDPVDKGSSSVEADQGTARSSRRGRRGASSTGNDGGQDTAAQQPEPQKPSGPTAAQIAAAAHAAALKSAAAVAEGAAEGDGNGAAHAFPEDSGPWDGQDEQQVEQHSASDAEGSELESDAYDPAHGAAVPEGAPEGAVQHQAAAEPAPGPAPEQGSAPEPAAAAVPDPTSDGAPRPRRRRGRVVAPAGPPRTTSTEG